MITKNRRNKRFSPLFLTAYLLSVSIIIPQVSLSKPAVLTQPEKKTQDALIQFSTIGALMQGNYDGEITIRDIKHYGNTGIGTFDALDGEMVIIDRKIYQVTSEGKVNLIRDKSVKSPFMVVTNLHPDQKVSLPSFVTYQDLKNHLDQLIQNKNQFYVIRIDGIFKSVKTRSVPRQSKPYPVLSEVTKNQPVFDYQKMNGSLVGFWCPGFVDGINVPGYHLHFISNDRTSGGHLLDCNLESGTLFMEGKKDFIMKLPENSSFSQTQLDPNIKKDIEKVEK